MIRTTTTVINAISSISPQGRYLLPQHGDETPTASPFSYFCCAICGHQERYSHKDGNPIWPMVNVKYPN